jgi:hypothetical protein
MNTVQIAHALEQDPVTSRTFCGVFPINKLPQTLIKYPCCFVANTDPSDKPGTHWVAFYFPTEEKGEFFDIYGQPPSFYRDSFGDFLNKHSYEWKFNTYKLQSAWSNVCGQYCIFYLSHRARGLSMSKIAQLFNDNTMLNDAKVSQFVKNRFKVLSKQPFVGLNQFSKKMIEK